MLIFFGGLASPYSLHDLRYLPYQTEISLRGDPPIEYITGTHSKIHHGVKIIFLGYLYMQTGPHYENNHKRIALLTEADWKVALAKSKEHLKWKLWQKTLSGVHSASSLGADPIEHYLGMAYEKILTGEWEWKEQFTLAQQMIRIINSSISKEVDKATTAKGQVKIFYHDQDEQFYDIEEPAEMAENIANEAKLKFIEAAIAGDEELEFVVEALKEGKKRIEIAKLLEIKPRQLDKIKERLFRKIKNHEPS